MDDTARASVLSRGVVSARAAAELAFCARGAGACSRESHIDVTV